MRKDVRRRLVLFTPGLLEQGGAARRSRLFASGLADRGWEVLVVARSATSTRLRTQRDGRVLLVEIPGFGRRRLGAALYLVLGVPLGLVLGRRPAGYLAVQVVSPALAAGICGVLTRRPYVAFTSTTGELSEVDAVLASRTAPLRRYLLRRAAHLVAQTPEAAEELAPLIDRRRIAVIPTPVVPADRPPLNGEPRVLYLGRLSSEKNLERLLAAWRCVAGSVPGATLTFAGAGGAYRPVEEDLRAIVAADDTLAASVRFLGWVDSAEPHLRENDVFVLPSLSEGMSNALLEACAAGRVVVASDIPGNRAVVGDDHPLLFPPEDTARLAAVLRRALTDHAARADAVARVRDRLAPFELASVAARVEALLGTPPASAR